MSFSYENLDLSKLMGDIFHTHQLMMPEGVELKIRVPHEPLIIRSDHFRLTQVCTNFINNAVKFTAKGYIEIGYELSADGKSILISVKDTGKGIPDDKKEKVFERFQKLDEFAQGTGLGLAICQSIVHTFHGSISLESEVSVGSKFTISLPYTPGLELEERTLLPSKNRLLALASSCHWGMTVSKNFCLARCSASISRPIYCWAFAFVEISGIGTSWV